MSRSAHWYLQQSLAGVVLGASAGSSFLLFLPIAAAALPEDPALMVAVPPALTIRGGDTSAQMRAQVRATPPAAECRQWDGDVDRPEQRYLYVLGTGGVLAVEYVADHVTGADWLVNGVDVDPARLQCADS